MYREIEFRGKRIDEYAPGTMVYGSLYQNKDGRCFIRVETNDKLDMFEVDPDSVCQFTGLYDMYHRKIYENDLLILVNEKFYRIFKVVYGTTTRCVRTIDDFEENEIPNVIEINGWMFEMIYTSETVEGEIHKQGYKLLPNVINNIPDYRRMEVINTDYHG